MYSKSSTQRESSILQNEFENEGFVFPSLVLTYDMVAYLESHRWNFVQLEWNAFVFFLKIGDLSICWKDKAKEIGDRW